MFFGIILIVVGAIFLAQNLNLISGDVWGTFWPIILIALGAGVLLKKGGGGHCWCSSWGSQRHKESQ